jgi:hypothetical protein
LGSLRQRLAKTFALAIDEASKLHPAAEPLVLPAALLASEPIPLFLFSEAREKLGEPLAYMLAGDGRGDFGGTMGLWKTIKSLFASGDSAPPDAPTADHAAPLMAELKRIERVVSRRKGD